MLSQYNLARRASGVVESEFRTHRYRVAVTGAYRLRRIGGCVSSLLQDHIAYGETELNNTNGGKKDHISMLGVQALACLAN